MDLKRKLGVIALVYVIEGFPMGVFQNVLAMFFARAGLSNTEIGYLSGLSLAWTLKAWFGLLLPVAPRWCETHEADRRAILRMDFRTFLGELMLVPAQIVRTGRRTFFRILAWRRRLELLFRLLEAV